MRERGEKVDSEKKREAPYIQIAREHVRIMLKLDDECLAAMIRVVFSDWLDEGEKEICPIPAEIMYLLPLVRDKANECRDHYLAKCLQNKKNREAANKTRESSPKRTDNGLNPFDVDSS